MWGSPRHGAPLVLKNEMANPFRLVREVNKIDGYRSLCQNTHCDPFRLVREVKEIEG